MLGEPEIRRRIVIPWGPWAILIAPAIPLGVGFVIEGNLTVASFEFTLEGRNGASFELGVECDPAPGPCRSIEEVLPVNELKPSVNVPSSNDMRVDLSARAYFATGIEVVFGLDAFPFSFVEATIGPKQQATFAFTDAQAEKKDYASNYALLFELEAHPGQHLAKAIEKLIGDDRGGVSFQIKTEESIAKSPEGTLNVDKTKVAYGDVVKLTVDLDPTTVDYFIQGYNVEAIEIYQKLESSGEFELLRRIPVTASAQTRFQEQWMPRIEDVGTSNLFAFVTTALPVVQLEIAKDSGKQVEVTGPGGWTGTMTYTATGSASLSSEYEDHGGDCVSQKDFTLSDTVSIDYAGDSDVLTATAIAAVSNEQGTTNLVCVGVGCTGSGGALLHQLDSNFTATGALNTVGENPIIVGLSIEESGAYTIATPSLAWDVEGERISRVQVLTTASDGVSCFIETLGDTETVRSVAGFPPFDLVGQLDPAKPDQVNGSARFKSPGRSTPAGILGETVLISWQFTRN